MLRASPERLTLSIKILFSAAVMVICLWLLNPQPGIWAGWNGLTRFAVLTGLVMTGIAVYLLLLVLLGLRPNQFRMQTTPSQGQ